jgi:hypothetical protein
MEILVVGEGLADQFGADHRAAFSITLPLA